MHRLKHFTLTFLPAFLLSASLFPACGDETVSPDCENGQCDVLKPIRSLIADAKKLDLGDLVALGSGYATDGINSALNVTSYASMRLAPTVFYSTADVAQGDLTLKNLDGLVSGLAARFGDKALSTEVNRVRADHLRNSSDEIFAESAFTVSAALNHGWGFQSKGLLEDTSLSSYIGFNASASLEARVVGAYKNELVAVGQSPLSALKTGRGFIFPTKLDEVRAMRPGESFALRGQGTLGVNVGASVPILIAEPTSFLTYNLVLSAGLSSQLTGKLDVQLVRLEGGEVVVDVGMDVSDIKSAHIGIKQGWGLSGLPDQLNFVNRKIDIAGIKEVDVGKLVQNALLKQLREKLQLVKAEASRTDTSIRMSISRLRFDLDFNQPAEVAQGAIGEALAQALKGDIRLAQALANRGDSGVKAEFDLLRSGASTASHAGLELFGMKFFTDKLETEGSVVIQTPGGVTSLLFESLHRSSGWFFSSHGYGRTGLAGLMYNVAEGGSVRGETNLFISTQQGDRFFPRDELLDQLDALIMGLAGNGDTYDQVNEDAKATIAAIETQTNALERKMQELCPHGPVELLGPCNINAINSDPDVDRLREAARKALLDRTLDLDKDLRDMLIKIVDLKIAAQSVVNKVSANAYEPRASVVLDYRLDDGALEDIFRGHTGLDFQFSVLRFLQVTQVDRVEDDNLVGSRLRIVESVADSTNAMGDAFNRYAKSYIKMVGIENTPLVGLDGAGLGTMGELGANPLALEFSVDKDNRVDYQSAAVSSLAQARSTVATDFFDEMIRLADKIPRSGTGSAPDPERTVAYGLLGVTNPEHLDLRVDIDIATSCSGPIESCADLSHYEAAGFDSFDMRAKGAKVQAIGDGLFNIDSLINLQ